MSNGHSFGLQWRLAAVCLAAGVTGAFIAIAVFLAAESYGLEQTASLGLSLAAGLLVGLVAAIIGSIITRSIKLRLWEAGMMAGRIARGDYNARLAVGLDDEVGWLEEQLNQMATQLEKAVGSLKELAENNRLLAEEAGRGSALEERMRLARDLHDTVNQQLFVLAMRSAALKRRLDQRPEDTAVLVTESESIEQLSRQAHSQIRDLIMQLRPVTLEKEGLAAALKEYIKKTAESKNWQLIDQIDPLVDPEPALGESLFRIAQEALNNISKHASAKTVEVLLTGDTQEVILRITDDGIGFDPDSAASPTSVGLSGIKERASNFGGKVDIESAAGAGTKLTVTVPFKERGRNHNDNGNAC